MKGSFVALATPMTSDGKIDYSAFAHLLDWHQAEGTVGVVILGTTGEAATIHIDERIDFIKFAVGHVKDNYPVIVGTATNATDSTLALTQQAKTLGATAALIATPYYNKPTQEGLYQHYKTVAEAVDIPILLYNVPGRTACDMQPETVVRLSKIENIIGIKEATGDLTRARFLRAQCGPHFILHSGDDATALDFIFSGGNGVISVTANIVPKQMQTLMMHAIAAEKEKAQAINQQIKTLHEGLFVESNPIPVKWALHKMGLIKKGIRLPLTWLSEEQIENTEQLLKATGVI